MTFGAKLAKLTDGENRSKISRSAGLPPNAVSDYINKGYLPRVDTALSLARVLKVSLDWLADDAQDWPAPKPGGHRLGAVASFDLMREACRRYRDRAVSLRYEIQRAERMDWKALAKKLAATPPDADAAPEITAAREVEHWLSGVGGLAGYDASKMV